MAFEGEQLKVTELDFKKIKDNLIDYIKNSDSEFTDWDWEGSNLNQFMDVLAYNTHYNAMLAHMAVNESFIDSAQIRSNIVSMAKLLGYVPKSFSASKAELDGRFVVRQVEGDSSSSPDTFTLERGVRFNTVSSAGSFQFVVLDELIPLSKDPEDNNFYITDPDNPIIVYQGRLVTKEFVANGEDDQHRYVIDEFNVDISTLKVRVFPTANKTPGTSTLFQPIGTQIDLGTDSAIYFINENSFGKYEFQFGNGTFGKKLNPGNVIELEYLITDGSVPNGIKSNFRLQSVVQEIEGTETLTLRDRISGGGERESNNRLKQSATNSFVIQNRAVTAEDYKHLILANFQFTESASVWGGEDNDPPLYGQTFISIKPREADIPENGLYLTPLEKNRILQFLQGKKVLSILPKIIDPKYVNIVLDILFKYDSNNIPTSRGELENNIRTGVVKTFNDTELNSFDTIFRHSAFQRTLDNFDRSILNSLVRVFVKQSFNLDEPAANEQTQTPATLVGSLRSITLDFGVPLVVDDGVSIVEVKSNIPWTENGEDIFLGDEADPTDANRRVIYSFAVKTGGNVVRKRTVGSIDLQAGKIVFTGSSLYSDNEITLTILMLPRSNDIVGKRNLLLNIDTDSCSIRGTVDEITAGGSSRSVNYITFDRDRAS